MYLLKGDKTSIEIYKRPMYGFQFTCYVENMDFLNPTERNKKEWMLEVSMQIWNRIIILMHYFRVGK